tara:strand:+ start:4133 stop:4570 length:438 start_codon:yes stop_codon:yes gene_type:complete
MSTKQGAVLLFIAGVIAVLTAFAHLSCIFLGPQCFETQMAPVSVIESAKAGTLLAPLGTVVVSTVFIVFGCYAFSGATLIRRLPLLSFGIYAIAAACIIRGILPIQLWIRQPDRVTDTVLIVGGVWLLVGLCYFFGYKAINGKCV